MLIATPSAVQLCELMKNRILNTPYFMTESSVHMAIEYFKASFKKDIELKDNLSEDAKQKQLFDVSFVMAEENLKSQLKVQGRLMTSDRMSNETLKDTILANEAIGFAK